MADPREELVALRRMAELEAKATPAGGFAPQPEQMNPLQARMGIRGMRAGQGTDTLLSNIAQAPYDLGGAITDLTGSPVMGTAALLGAEALPMMVGGVAGAASKVPEAAQGLGRWMMGKALGPSAMEWRTGKAPRAINTMLEEGFSPTKSGVEGMRAKVAELGDEVSGILSSSGKELDKQALLDRLLETKAKAMKTVNPNTAIADIERVGKEFAEHPLFTADPLAKEYGVQALPIKAAQEMKQATGRELGSSAYGMGLKPEAERDAKKALVRALKEDISKAEPAVAPLNAREGELLNALKMAEHRAAMQTNRNLLGLAPAAHSPELAIGFLADRSAALKAALARLLYSQSPAAGAPAGRLAGTMGAYLAGQQEE